MGGGHRLLYKGQSTLITQLMEFYHPTDFLFICCYANLTRWQTSINGFLRKLNFLAHFSYFVLYVGI